MPIFKNLASLNLTRDLRVFLSLEIGVGRSVRSSSERLEDGGYGIVKGAPKNLKIPPTAAAEIEKSRKRLREPILQAAEEGDVTFVRSYGNIGDHLIYAGTRSLLAGVPYKEIAARNQLDDARGRTAIMSGGGDWCQAFHSFNPKVLPELEKRFEKVIVLPTSFDPSLPLVRRVLRHSKALIFAREHESYRRIKNLCNAELGHDTAFFFDYSPYVQRGKGVLNAYRTDPETARSPDTEAPLPPDNDDISVTCSSLDQWLWTISRHEAIHTDRAHIMIAGALMGKRVEYRASNYFKVPAIAEHSLQGFPVRRREDWSAT